MPLESQLLPKIDLFRNGSERVLQAQTGKDGQAISLSEGRVS